MFPLFTIIVAFHLHLAIAQITGVFEGGASSNFNNSEFKSIAGSRNCSSPVDGSLLPWFTDFTISGGSGAECTKSPCYLVMGIEYLFRLDYRITYELPESSREVLILGTDGVTIKTYYRNTITNPTIPGQARFLQFATTFDDTLVNLNLETLHCGSILSYILSFEGETEPTELPAEPTFPPATVEPETNAPVTDPPATDPPATNPPVTNVPVPSTTVEPPSGVGVGEFCFDILVNKTLECINNAFCANFGTGLNDYICVCNEGYTVTMERICSTSTIVSASLFVLVLGLMTLKLY